MYPRKYCSMSLMKAMAICDFLGFSQVLITGADNDYVNTVRLSPDNKVHNIERHSSGNLSPIEVLVSQETEYSSFLDWHKAMYSLEWSWNYLSQRLTSRVLNLDNLSYLSVFPKVTPDSIYFDLLTPSARRKSLDYISRFSSSG